MQILTGAIGKWKGGNVRRVMSNGRIKAIILLSEIVRVHRNTRTHVTEKIRT